MPVEPLPFLQAAPAEIARVPETYGPQPEKSWTQIGKDAVSNLLGALTGRAVDSVGDLISGVSGGAIMTPAQLEALRRQREAEEAQKTMLIVGGLGVAVLLGVMLMRRH